MNKEQTSDFIRIGLGVDAGGTYTDAVVYDLENNKTLCKAKSLTTKWDYTVGIGKALKKLDQNQLRNIELVSLSTTLVTNAIVENEGQKVGLILMPPYGLDVTRHIPFQPKAIIQGQLEISGREIVPVDPEEIKKVVREMVDKHQVKAFAVSGFAGFINAEHELRVKEIIQELTGMFVSCGHELSDNLNYNTRAVTAMLNARNIPRLTNLLRDLEKVMDTNGIEAPVVVVKGDGTLMSAEMARKRPVETILSGPAASVAGARHLTGLDNALVVDMGGTTTDTAALSNGMVALNEQGSFVGGHRTHVRALDIRTSGLGGDSLILFDKGKFHIGPKRVAPISWVGETWPNVDPALDYINFHIKHHTGSTRKMQILVKTGDRVPDYLTDQEKEILGILEERPYTIDELVHKMDVLTENSLPLEHLEEEFLIQKCGLTLTDLLHMQGEFVKWNTETARKYAKYYSIISHTPMQEMIEQILVLGKRLLSLELLKRRLSDDMDPDKMDECPVCQSLIEKLLIEQSPDYEIAINFKHPVIGIGAPIRYFLDTAVTPFQTSAILPEDVDVANAIGAITSMVYVRKQIKIQPKKDDGFVVEGVTGSHMFKKLADADNFSRESLREMVLELAREAGTSATDVKIESKDSETLIFTGELVLINRTLVATLKGKPDLVVKNRRSDVGIAN